MNHNIVLRLLPILTAIAFIACGKTTDISKLQTTEERFKAAMAALEEKEYLTARQLFETILLQDPASDYADDAQFYLAESYFRNEEYKLAAFNYNRLRSSFPSSEFARVAMFKAAESYQLGAPPFDRDQRDSKLAIDQFSIFVELFPSDSLSQLARARIFELKNKLAHKDYVAAEQYYKISDFTAAIIYYDRVIDAYNGTDYYGPAIVGKVKAYRQLDRNVEALEEIKKHLTDALNSDVMAQLQSIEKELSR